MLRRLTAGDTCRLCQFSLARVGWKTCSVPCTVFDFWTCTILCSCCRFRRAARSATQLVSLSQDNIQHYLERGMEVNTKDNAGYTALHEACVQGRLDTALLLLEFGADTNVNSTDGTRFVFDVVFLCSVKK